MDGRGQRPARARIHRRDALHGNLRHTTLSPNTWTRIRFESHSSGTGNNLCEVRLFVAPQAPTLPSPSQLSTLSPTATAFVTDGAMTIDAGDMVMCASTANPNAPAYSFHMVTTGATGVSSSSLRLDNSSAAPTFTPSTRFSKLAPAGGDAVLVTDGALVINAGDLVLCNICLPAQTTPEYQPIPYFGT